MNIPIISSHKYVSEPQMAPAEAGDFYHSQFYEQLKLMTSYAILRYYFLLKDLPNNVFTL